MITPYDCVVKILDDRPDLAEPLYDLLICARSSHGAFMEAALDEVEEIIYSKTEHCKKQRDAYKKRKLVDSSIPPDRAGHFNGLRQVFFGP